MSRRIPSATSAFAAIAATSVLALTACSSSTETAETAATSAAAAPAADSIPLPEFDQAIADLFPASVAEAGEINLATISFPPYSYKDEDGSTDIGINWDMIQGIEAVTGYTVNLEVVPGVADIYTGFDSGRFDGSISPLSDTPTTEENFDFATWLNEYVVFLQKSDTDHVVDSLVTACGATIATLQGGAAQTVLEEATTACADDNQIDIALYGNQDEAVLAVKSGRADAAFSSQIPLTYYTLQDDSLVVSGANSTDNGFPPFAVGYYGRKGNELVEGMLAALNSMQSAGTYDYILDKYEIQNNAVETFGINTAVAS